MGHKWLYWTLQSLMFTSLYTSLAACLTFTSSETQLCWKCLGVTMSYLGMWLSRSLKTSTICSFSMKLQFPAQMRSVKTEKNTTNLSRHSLHSNNIATHPEHPGVSCKNFSSFTKSVLKFKKNFKNSHFLGKNIKLFIQKKSELFLFLCFQTVHFS